MAGFGQPVVILIAAVSIVGEGLIDAGVAYRLGEAVMKAGGSDQARLVTVVMITGGSYGAAYALNGEWSLGSMLVAETWPAHLRGRVISINRGMWCLGASFAGAIAGLVASRWGWRAAVIVPGIIALLAIYIRATCPNPPTGSAPRIGSGASLIRFLSEGC